MDAVGIAGTAPMVATRMSSSWEFTSESSDFGDDAPAPARVGKLVADAVGLQLPPSAVRRDQQRRALVDRDRMGKLAGEWLALRDRRSAWASQPESPRWSTSWRSSAGSGSTDRSPSTTETLWKDFSAHLVFGTTLGAVLTV